MFFKKSTYGKDFKYEVVSVPDKDGKLIYWHDISASITAEIDEEKTLNKAWELVVDLAEYLKKKIKKKPSVTSFRIIVGWSKEAREEQGQIFKIWRSNEELEVIINSKSLKDYQETTEHYKHYIPFKGWQRDIFKDKKGNA